MDISTYQHMNIRMSTRGKRPLRNLTPSDKVRAIQRIHNGETKASVSRDIGVPESTLRGWCKNEQKLRFMCRQLGADHLGLSGLDNPPEKRSKYDEPLITPKFGVPHNFDDLTFNRIPFHTVDFAPHSSTSSSSNTALLERIAFTEFIKKNGLNPEMAQKLDEELQVPSIATLPSSMGHVQNNMMHQLNLLSLLSPSLSSMTATQQSGDAINTNGLKLKKTLPATVTTDSNADDLNRSHDKEPTPTLSVKNWAKDPAEQSDSKRNDNNNNDLLNNSLAAAPLVFPEVKPFSNIFPECLPPVSSANSNTAEPDASNNALLDWCKMFNASLNFLAFAAATAAMQPNLSASTLGNSEDLLSLQNQESNDEQNGLLNLKSHMNSFLNSETSNGSYCDSEPEDLSLRSSASKLSSPAHSRSQSPIKSSASSSLHSDSEQ